MGWKDLYPLSIIERSIIERSISTVIIWGERGSGVIVKVKAYFNFAFIAFLKIRLISLLVETESHSVKVAGV